MAGMPVEVFIKTSPRTVVSYLTKPLRDQIDRAFRGLSASVILCRTPGLQARIFVFRDDDMSGPRGPRSGETLTQRRRVARLAAASAA